MIKMILIWMALAAGACAHTSSPALTSPPAQSPQSSGPTIQVTTPQPVKTVGKASVAHDQKSNRSTAKVSFYVVGRPEEIKNVDVLQIEARIEGSGKESMKPEEVYFRLYSYSHVRNINTRVILSYRSSSMECCLLLVFVIRVLQQ